MTAIKYLTYQIAELTDFTGVVCTASAVRRGDTIFGNGGPDPVVDYVDTEDFDQIDVWTGEGSYERYIVALAEENEREADRIFEEHCEPFQPNGIVFLAKRAEEES